MQASFGLELTTTVLVIIAITCIVVLVLIVVAPWRRIRAEPPLDPDVQTRLLLHRPNPEEETGEMPTARVTNLEDVDAKETGDFADLRELDES